MSKTGLVGLIVTIVLVISLTLFVFSKIEIEPVFMTQTSGINTLTQGGVATTNPDGSPITFLDIIGKPVSDFFNSINPFKIKLW